MGKPIIGIVTLRQEGTPLPRYGVTGDYIEQTERAGGSPVLLPITPGTGLVQLRKWVELCDGLLLPGGADIDPAFYGQPPLLAAEGCVADGCAAGAPADPYAHFWQQNELDFIRMAAHESLPMLGICLGAQAINVALGGTLIQDIPTQVPGAADHSGKQRARTELSHTAAVKPGTLLAKIEGLPRGGEIAVNSFHHQAVGEAAPHLTVSAVSPDGVVEAVESARHAILGIQWHPENLAATRPEAAALFAWLIHEAK